MGVCSALLRELNLARAHIDVPVVLFATKTVDVRRLFCGGLPQPLQLYDVDGAASRNGMAQCAPAHSAAAVVAEMVWC